MEPYGNKNICYGDYEQIHRCIKLTLCLPFDEVMDAKRNWHEITTPRGGTVAPVFVHIYDITGSPVGTLGERYAHLNAYFKTAEDLYYFTSRQMYFNHISKR